MGSLSLRGQNSSRKGAGAAADGKESGERAPQPPPRAVCSPRPPGPAPLDRDSQAQVSCTSVNPGHLEAGTEFLSHKLVGAVNRGPGATINHGL